MLKRQQLKFPLYGLVILTGFSVLLSLAAIIYQIVAKFIGFGNTQILETSCTSYVNYKLSNSVIILKISFIALISEIAFLIAIFTLMVVGICKLVRKQNEDKYIDQADPVSKYRMSNSKLVQYDDFYTYRKLIFSYIIYSLAILCAIMHFGLVINLVISQSQCKHSFYVALIVIGALSGLSLILLMVCWIILQVLRCRIHNYLDDFQEINEPLQIYNVSNRQRKPTNQAGTLEMLNMNTLFPLKTEEAEYTKYNNQITEPPQNANKKEIQIQNKQVQVIDESKNYVSFKGNEAHEIAGPSNIKPTPKFPLNIESQQLPIKQSYVSPRREVNQNYTQQKIGSPQNKQIFLNYMKEQNSSPQPDRNINYVEFTSKNDGKPFFKSPGKKSNSQEKKFQSTLQRYISRDEKQKNASSLNDNVKFISRQKNYNFNQNQNSYGSLERAENKIFAPSISQKKLNQQEKNYYQSVNNYNSVLRKDSLIQRSQDDGSRDLHKNMQKEISFPVQDEERFYERNPNGQKSHNKTKKKGLLIDYIRSKYVD